MNALAMERAGAAIAIREDELSAEELAARVRELLRGNIQRRNMAEAARRLGRPEAAAAIVDDLCAWLGMPTDGPASDDRNRAQAAASGGGGGDAGDSGRGAGPTALRTGITRRPKVRRAPLRVRAVELPVDVTG
jgi:hypothetical protein